MIKKRIYNIVLKLQGRDIRKEYLEISRIYDKNDLLEFKNLYLKKLILHAYEKVPYYHRLLKTTNIINNTAIDLSKFENIPILTKEKIRNEVIISKDYKKRNWYYNTSGGSTGEPTKFIQDINYNKWYNVTETYYYKDILNIDQLNAKKIILWDHQGIYLKARWE